MQPITVIIKNILKLIAALVGTNLSEVTLGIIENLRQTMNEDEQFASSKKKRIYLEYTVGSAH